MKLRTLVILIYQYLLPNLIISSSDSDLCDVKMWYLDMLSEGVLHGNLSPKQEHVKSSVEKLIHSQKGSIKLDCETLVVYENVLYDVENEEYKLRVDSEQEEHGTESSDEIQNEDPQDDGQPANAKENHSESSDENHSSTEDIEMKEDLDEQLETTEAEDPTENEDQSAVERETQSLHETDDIADPVLSRDDTQVHTEERSDAPENADDLADEAAEDTDITELDDSDDETGNSSDDNFAPDYGLETPDSVTERDLSQNELDGEIESKDVIKTSDCETETEIQESEADSDTDSKEDNNVDSSPHKLFRRVQMACFGSNVCNIFEPLFVCHSLWSAADKVEQKKVAETKPGGQSVEDTVTLSHEIMEDEKLSSHEAVAQRHEYNKTKLDANEIEELLSRKKTEYAHKIQEIELQLLRLENHLLSETLHKQNNSASYTRLENLILKLENELLKINRSFVTIQEENNKLKAKQLSEEQIYSIFNKAKEANKDAEEKYLALADNSTALETMVDKQQSKIIELVLMMHNQTDFINKLEEKSQRLEDQNRQLHEVLVNQSNMMSELVKGMKYMKEEQEKLKTTVAHPLPLTTQEPKVPLNADDVSADTVPPIVRDDGESQEKLDEKVGKSEHLNEDEGDTKEAEDGTKEGNKKVIADGEASSTAGEDEAKLTIERKEFTPDKKLQLLRERRQKEYKAENSKEYVEKNSITQDKGSMKKDDRDDRPLNTLNEVNRERKSGNETSPRTKATPTKGKKSDTATVIIPEMPKYFKSKPSGPQDCYDHHKSGKRKRDMAMRVKVGLEGHDLQVFCDMKNGGWTVIMRRSDGSIDFFRDWKQYKDGFGGVLGEHWIGNDVLHLMTNQKNYRLRVEMTDWDRSTAWAEYDYFMTDDESQGYKLHVAGFNSDSSAGDGFLKHNGMKFSTKDVDNDLAVKDFNGSCSNRFHGAWWYYKCYKSNLTGKYYRDGLIAEGMHDGISWKSWRPSTVSLKKVEMKIMPRNSN